MEQEKKAGENLPKIIGFLGSYPVDICLYAAFVMQNTGKGVCVIDNSNDGVLYECIPTPDKRLEVITYHNVDFMRNKPLVKWQDLEYEFVLIQLGDQPQVLCMAACDELVLIVDCERRNLDFYNQFMQQSKMSMTVLLRGYCPDGISGKIMKEHFERENCFIEKWMTLPLDEVDEAYRIAMQYGQVKKFTHISTGMEKVLIQLLRMLDAKNTAGIIRAVKAAKNGRAAGSVYR